MAAVALKERSKRYRERASLIMKEERFYSVPEAVETMKKIAGTRFDETVNLDIQLGIQPGQNEENVRGTVRLPHGTGKKIRVICFCKGEEAKAAKQAGAVEVGAEELVQKIQGGWLDFDIAVAHPDMMREVSKLGKILGPKGMMPSPKAGTVTPEVGKAVRELQAGRVEFKNDKTGGLHGAMGKLSFSSEALQENILIFLRAVRDAKPAAVKGNYFRRITVAPTQGPGFSISTTSF